MQTKTNGRSRHAKYKVGTCKLTVTVENEDKIRVKRRAARMGYKDYSAFLREVVHQAVWDEVLTAEDYETLKQMKAAQENQ